MKCDAARRRLLGSEHPDRPADDVRRHLTGCADCRLWSRRLSQLERQIPLLPVPPSSGKDGFVRRFRRPAGPVVRPMMLPWPTPVKERGLQKLSLAVAIAAVLAVFTLGWSSWPRQLAPAPRPEPAWVVNLRGDRERIFALQTPRERVEKLTELATDLQARARTMTRTGDAENLARLATVYGDLVGDDLLTHARALPADERPAVLEAVAARLVRAESEFTRLAAEKDGSPTAEPLQNLALAARDGDRHIRALLKAA